MYKLIIDIINQFTYLFSGVFNSIGNQQIFYEGAGGGGFSMITVLPSYLGMLFCILLPDSFFKTNLITKEILNKIENENENENKNQIKVKNKNIIIKNKEPPHIQIILIALIDVTGNTFSQLSIYYTGIGMYQVIFSSVIIFTALLGRIVLSKKLNFIQWISIIIVTFGLVLTHISVFFEDSTSFSIGMLFSMITTFFYACNWVFSEYVLQPDINYNNNYDDDNDVNNDSDSNVNIITNDDNNNDVIEKYNPSIDKADNNNNQNKIDTVNTLTTTSSTIEVKQLSPKTFSILMGIYCTIFTLIYMSLYTFPHFSGLILSNVQNEHGRWTVIIIIFISLIIFSFLNALSYFSIVSTPKGSITIGILQALRAVFVFLFSQFLFCNEKHQEQCFNLWKILASIIILGGVFLYNFSNIYFILNSKPSSEHKENIETHQ
eukprot:TRINITY_DN6190_c3_g1_i1.p1 TRINITY_DN6190_c3_g1~~TRINITY_DN6190_c3_g1_i1.p1  ORF type:complete len:434 (+),score=66.01 TRINITY_DN6190_c3_g1_i1:132-1433(+)